MIYFLLIIIAIGVLLLSNEGKQILRVGGVLMKIALIVLGIIIALVSAYKYRDTLVEIFGFLLAIVFITLVIDKWKQISAYLKKEIKWLWSEHKIGSVICLTGLVFLIYLSVTN